MQTARMLEISPGTNVLFDPATCKTCDVKSNEKGMKESFPFQFRICNEKGETVYSRLFANIATAETANRVVTAAILRDQIVKRSVFLELGDDYAGYYDVSQFARCDLHPEFSWCAWNIFWKVSVYDPFGERILSLWFADESKAREVQKTIVNVMCPMQEAVEAKHN